MRLYLDDHLASPVLARFLRQARHDVQLPADVGLAGENDAVHLRQAVREHRASLTKDYGDFEELHYLVLEVGGHHPGIFVIREDNDPKRDLTPRGIVKAIAKLLAARAPIADQYIILNHWR